MEGAEQAVDLGLEAPAGRPADRRAEQVGSNELQDYSWIPYLPGMHTLRVISLSNQNDLNSARPFLSFSSQDESGCESPKRSSHNFHGELLEYT